MQPGRRYAALHTHASSTAFSDEDVVVLVGNDLLHTVAAVGFDGTWYILSKVPGRPTANAAAVVAALNAAFAHLSPASGAVDGAKRARALYRTSLQSYGDHRDCPEHFFASYPPHRTDP